MQTMCFWARSVESALVEVELILIRNHAITKSIVNGFQKRLSSGLLLFHSLLSN